MQAAFDAVVPVIDPTDKFSAHTERKVKLAPAESLDLGSHIVGRRGKQKKPQHARTFHVIEVSIHTPTTA